MWSRARSVGTGLTVTLLLAVAGCGSSAPSNDAVGFEDPSRPVDTSPFTMEGLPGEGSSTTIADGFFEDQISTSTSSTPTSTTTTTTAPPPPPTTTTTTIPDNPLVPPLAQIENLCGFTDMVLSMQRLSGRSPAEVQRIMGLLPDAIDRYRAVGPASTKADLLSIRRTIESYRDLLRDNGWNADAKAFTDRIERYNSDPSLDDEFPIRLNRVANEEAIRCR